MPRLSPRLLGPAAAVLALLSAAACRPAPDAGGASRFLAEFSLRDLLSQKGLEMARHGEMTFAESQGGFPWKSQTLHHRRWSADIALAPADEERFLRTVRDLLRRRLEAAGFDLRHQDGRPSQGHFSFGYSGEGAFGWLDVQGLAGSPGSYRLVVTATEADALAGERR